MSHKITMLLEGYLKNLLELAAEYADDEILRLERIRRQEKPNAGILEKKLQQSLGEEVSLQNLEEVFKAALRKKDWLQEHRDLFNQLRGYRDWLDTQEENFETITLEKYKDSAKEVWASVLKLSQQVEDFLQSAVRRVDAWSGSPIIVFPIYDKNTPWSETPSFDVQLQVPGKPGFTLFSDLTLGDVLDAKDTEFFKTDEAETDYFNLVAEIESPGSTSKPGKKTVIWTARPLKDRHKYENARSIPSGIFAASDIGHVEGLASDLGNDEIRDIYRIVIDSRYLRITLDHGRLKEYQVIGQGVVPVFSIELAQEGHQKVSALLWKSLLRKAMLDKKMRNN